MRIRASTQTHRLKICLLTGMLTMALAGCGSTNWGLPYRTTVQQGNWITSEQVAQLQVGMTRDQVRFILGTPTLEDVFHADRWDYPFYNQPGYGKDELRKFTVWFKDDKLVRWSGDNQPDRQPFQKVDSGREAIQPASGKGAAAAKPDASGAAATNGAATGAAVPSAVTPNAAAPSPNASAPGVTTPGAAAPSATAPIAPPAAPPASAPSGDSKP